MNRTTVLLACLLVAGASLVSGQEMLHAILQTGDFELSVDSLGRRYESGFDTLVTPNFGGEPQMEDTVNLESADQLLQAIIFWSVRGEPQREIIWDFPNEDEWYIFPLDDPAQMMFSRFEPGIAEGSGSRLPRVSASPNPFSGRSLVSCQLARAGELEVAVFDRAGALVRTLCDSRLEAGAHRFAWDGRSDAGDRVAAGVYLVRARSADGAALHKLVLAD